MIPEELRQYLLSKMAVLESYERQFLPEKRMAERVLAWLDAQPEAPTERWEPVAEINRMSGTFIRPDDTSTPLRGLSILSEDGRICIDWRDGGVEVDLPADLRLCRRVEVKP